jgi:hypothetical protein
VLVTGVVNTTKLYRNLGAFQRSFTVCCVQNSCIRDVNSKKQAARQVADVAQSSRYDGRLLYKQIRL